MYVYIKMYLLLKLSHLDRPENFQRKLSRASISCHCREFDLGVRMWMMNRTTRCSAFDQRCKSQDSKREGSMSSSDSPCRRARGIRGSATTSPAVDAGGWVSMCKDSFSAAPKFVRDDEARGEMWARGCDVSVSRCNSCAWLVSHGFGGLRYQ